MAACGQRRHAAKGEVGTGSEPTLPGVGFFVQPDGLAVATAVVVCVEVGLSLGVSYDRHRTHWQ